VTRKILNSLLKNSSTGISILSWSIHVKPISTFSAKSFQCFRFSSVPSYNGVIHGKVSHKTYKKKLFIILNNVKLVKYNSIYFVQWQTNDIDEFNLHLWEFVFFFSIHHSLSKIVKSNISQHNFYILFNNY